MPVLRDSSSCRLPTNIIYVVLISDFDFHLPEELIAQEPLVSRSSSRMLYLRRDGGHHEDRAFSELPSLLRTGDLIVLNNSRVFPARLLGFRAGLHAQPVSQRNPAAGEFLRGQVEVLLTRRLDEWEWTALGRPGRKIGVGEIIHFGESELEAEVIARADFGQRTLRFKPVADFFEAVERLGHVPLPPYIHRADRPEDRERYQTVYARTNATGSIAAPTAGLHFTPETLSEMRGRGIEMAEITLHVGLGTFQPVRVENIEEHKMHTEPFFISEESAQKINQALEEKRRVVAVGTTVVRTLEYAARSSSRNETPHVAAGAGENDIFIYPGFHFRAVGAMLTNFHLPKSTLLMLVSAFAGRERILRAYEHAVQEKYRFFSYGDCMLIE